MGGWRRPLVEAAANVNRPQDAAAKAHVAGEIARVGLIGPDVPAVEQPTIARDTSLVNAARRAAFLKHDVLRIPSQDHVAITTIALTPTAPQMGWIRAAIRIDRE